MTTNATCSPMSTALSPIRSSARATSIIVIAHSRRSSSVPISTARRKTSRLSGVDLVVLAHEVLGQRDVAQHERLLGLRDLRAGELAHLEDALEHLLVGRRLVADQRQHLGDVHALVAHPLGVLDHVQQRRDGPQVAGHRRLQRQQREDPLVDLEEAAVDAVVVVDHDRGQLDVLVLERLQRAVERVDDEVERAERLLLEAAQLVLEVDARVLGHRQPTLPVT